VVHRRVSILEGSGFPGEPFSVFARGVQVRAPPLLGSAFTFFQGAGNADIRLFNSNTTPTVLKASLDKCSPCPCEKSYLHKNGGLLQLCLVPHLMRLAGDPNVAKYFHSNSTILESCSLPNFLEPIQLILGIRMAKQRDPPTSMRASPHFRSSFPLLVFAFPAAGGLDASTNS
jgi:hypothetical protein